MASTLIALDARHVRPGMTGVGRRIAHLLRAAVAEESEFRWGLFTNDSEFLTRQLSTSTGSMPPNLVVWPISVRPESHPANELWLNRHLPSLLQERGASLLDCPAFIGPWRQLSVPVVLTVHDMAHQQRPATQSFKFRQFLKLGVRRSALVAERIIVPSASVRQELVSAIPAVAGRVRVVPGGVPADLRPWSSDQTEAFRKSRRLPPQFLLHIGTFEPRKNHQFLLEVYGALCAEIDKPPPLVLVGAPGPALKRVAQWREQSPWRDRIRMYHGMPDEDLSGFVNAATALVFPSLSEGFGLPVLEAVAAGLPVIAAEVSGLSDLRHLPITLLPLGAVQPWVQRIRGILSDTALRNQLRERAPSVVEQHQWSHAARLLLDVYREALESHAPFSSRTIASACMSQA